MLQFQIIKSIIENAFTFEQCEELEQIIHRRIEHLKVKEQMDQWNAKVEKYLTISKEYETELRSFRVEPKEFLWGDAENVFSYRSRFNFSENQINVERYYRKYGSLTGCCFILKEECELGTQITLPERLEGFLRFLLKYY